MSAVSPKVVMTDYDFPALDLIYDALKPINAQFIPAQCQTPDQVIEWMSYCERLPKRWSGP
jgi:hypothetical protein